MEPVFFTYNLHDYYEKSINDANANLKDEKKLTAEMVEAEVQQQLDDLSQKYSVFGKISSGYDIVESLEQGDQILSIKIEEKAK
jgi:cyclophilin family peptidyl-prolyl cis-trans isomerase